MAPLTTPNDAGPAPAPAAKNPEQKGFVRGFAHGGLAAMSASCVTHPIDLVKVRMQLSGEGGTGQKIGVGRMAGNIVKQEGVAGLYKGLSASLMRQATYSTTRFGIYEIFKQRFTNDAGVLPFHYKAVGGLISGGIGAFVGTPADLTMVRMQSDGKLPMELRRNYKGVFDGFLRITREEGVVNLWKGCEPTVIRAMLVTAGQLATYDQAKQMLVGGGYLSEGLGLHFVSSLAAGLVATVLSQPVDLVKTRIFNMKPDASGRNPYTGMVDCFKQTVRAEGVMGLYKGFVPNYVRQGPHTITMFLALEQIRKLDAYLTGA